jgi:inhibitor of KinA
MTIIYSLESPGGWHLLGRTPVLMWDPRRAEPTLLAAGDKVTFTPVSRREYESILAQSTAGTYDLRPDGEAGA